MGKNNKNFGRGFGRGSRGNGGRGRNGGGRGRGRDNNNKKTKEYKFATMRPGQATATYADVFDKLILEVEQLDDGNLDMVESLQALERKDIQAPVLTASTESDPAKKALDDEHLKMLHSKELDLWLKQCAVLKENEMKVYAKIIKDFVTYDMKRKIEVHPEFHDKLKNNPYEVLKAIKVLTKQTVRT